jgi:hypothetical protein
VGGGPEWFPVGATVGGFGHAPRPAGMVGRGWRGQSIGGPARDSLVGTSPDNGGRMGCRAPGVPPDRWLGGRPESAFSSDGVGWRHFSIEWCPPDELQPGRPNSIRCARQVATRAPIRYRPSGLAAAAIKWRTPSGSCLVDRRCKSGRYAGTAIGRHESLVHRWQSCTERCQRSWLAHRAAELHSGKVRGSRDSPWISGCGRRELVRWTGIRRAPFGADRRRSGLRGPVGGVAGWPGGRATGSRPGGPGIAVALVSTRRPGFGASIGVGARRHVTQ